VLGKLSTTTLHLQSLLFNTHESIKVWFAFKIPGEGDFESATDCHAFDNPLGTPVTSF
jgi:hypothetical protein